MADKLDIEEKMEFETEDREKKIEAELVAKIDDDLGLYVTDEGEQVLISSDENLGGAKAMHRLYSSDAYSSMIDNIKADIEAQAEKNEADEAEAAEEQDAEEYGSFEDALDDPDSVQTAILSMATEDVVFDNIARVIDIINNLTDEQVDRLGPDGVEEVFIALSKFYYTSMQVTNPLFEVAQARYGELKKWQKLYMDKYYHK